MRQVIKVEKAQCCVFNNHINRELSSLNGVYGVFVDNYKNQITIDHTNEVTFEMIVSKIEENGYIVLNKTNADNYKSQLQKDDEFAHKAEEWDTPMRIKMAEKFVNELHNNINFTNKLKVLDFGCGTGLVGLQIAPLVKSAVLMDTSAAMTEVLKSKIFEDQLKVPKSDIKVINSEVFEYRNQDIDIVFSLMAMHHIENLNETINHIASILKPGGLLVIGDLKEEDGSFHQGEKVAHKGFNISHLSGMIEGSDLEVRKTYVYNTIAKNEREYEQFILIAQKPETNNLAFDTSVQNIE